MHLINPFRFSQLIVPGDTGYTIPGTAGEHQQSGYDNAWSDRDNIKTENDSTYARCGRLKADEESAFLLATNLGFSVPSEATITKVHAQGRLRSGSGDSTNATGYIWLFNGASNPIGNEQPIFSAIPTAYQTRSYEPNDNWGASLTPAIVNGSGFGFGFRLYANANSVRGFVAWMKLKVFWQ